MRIFKFKILLLSLILVGILAGCGQNKDTKIGKLEEQVKTLRAENARLEQNNAKNEINETGSVFTVIIISASILLINNLVWLIAYRRKS